MEIFDNNNVADISITFGGMIFACQGTTSHAGERIFVDSHRFCFVALKGEIEEKKDRVPKVLALPVLKQYARYAGNKDKLKLYNDNLKEEDITSARITRYLDEAIDIAVTIGNEHCIVRLMQFNTFTYFRNSIHGEFSMHWDA